MRTIFVDNDTMPKDMRENQPLGDSPGDRYNLTANYNHDGNGVSLVAEKLEGLMELINAHSISC